MIGPHVPEQSSQPVNPTELGTFFPPSTIPFPLWKRSSGQLRYFAVLVDAFVVVDKPVALIVLLA